MSAKGIKTRTVTKDIRAIDKAATAAERIKTATIKTKEEAAATQNPRESSASEYASDTVMDTLQAGAMEARHYAVKQAATAIDAAKQKIRSGQGESTFESNAYEGASEYGHAYRENPVTNQPTRQNADIKTRERAAQAQPTDDATRRPTTSQARRGKQEAPVPTRSQETIYQAQGRRKAVKDAKAKAIERQRVNLREQAQHQVELRGSAQRGALHPTDSKHAPAKPRIKGRAAQTAGVRIKSTASATQIGKLRTRSIKKAAQSIKTGEETSKAAIKTAEKAVAAAKTVAMKQSVETAKAAQAARKAAEKAKQTAKATAQALSKAAHAIAEAARSALLAILAGGWLSVLIAVIVCLFGVVVCLFAGTGANSTAELSISEEVYAYYDEIADAAERYGIPEYIQLIEAVMMQESGGIGTDPMQASECGYNTRFPRTPNSITDPLYSIDCGVHELADCLAAADVEGPADIERIRLALQGYNYGSGYISWALRKYGEYTLENAAEFSEMKKAQLGTSVYGDPEYAPHVLRYYSYNFLMAGNLMGSQMVIAVAGNEIGYTERANSYTKYGAWYGVPNGDWCAMFVSWCAEQCNYISTGICPKLSYVPDMVTWFQGKNLWFENSITPPVGAYIIFDWEQDGSADHVGFVEYIQDGYVHTIEGNSSDMVRRNSYPIGSDVILGYGIPMYWI